MKHSRFPKFTERFRELQGSRSDTEFAQILGITRQTVGFYKNGDRIPDALTLRNIALLMNVPSDYLLGLTDDPTRSPSAVDELHISPDAVQQLLGKDSESRKLCSRLIASFELWQILEIIMKMKEPNDVFDEQHALQAKVTAENDFRKNSGGTCGEVLYGEDYKDFLRYQVQELLQKFIEKEINDG